jgi:hypothetical protein
MAGTRRDAFTEALKKDLYDWFWEEYDETPPRYEDIFEVTQSDAAYTKFTSAIGLGDLLEKPEGEDLQTESPMESYTIVCRNRTWGRKVQMTYELVEDSQKVDNMIQAAASTWGKALPRTKDKWYAKFFNKGAYTSGYDSVFDNAITGVVEDSSGDFIYDGKPFFAASGNNHPDRVGGSYYNFSETNNLTHDNLKTVYLLYTVTNAKDERGENMEIEPDVLLIPGALRFTADVILNTTLIPGSQDNDTNVLRTIVAPMIWRQLDDSDSWFLGKLKHGLMATDRLDVMIDFYQDDTNLDYFARIVTRFGGVISNWRFWYGNNLAQSGS